MAAQEDAEVTPYPKTGGVTSTLTDVAQSARLVAVQRTVGSRSQHPFVDVARSRIEALGTQPDAFALRSFVSAFVRPDFAMGVQPASRAPRHRHANTGRSPNEIAIGLIAFDQATQEFFERQQRLAAFRAAQANAVELPEDGHESWANDSVTLLQFRNPQQKRAASALLATSLVTAGLLMSGSMQTQSVAASTAASVAERTSDTDVSRNALSAASPVPPAPELVAPAPIPAATEVPAPAPPVTEPPVTVPPPTAPPTTAAPPPPAPVVEGWATPTPGARLTSVYGKRTNPVTGRYSMHSGVDYAAATGTPIHAAQGGIITQAGWKSGYGYYTCIKHSSSVTSCYGHQSRINVNVGQQVSRGQIIGLVGNTGNSTGAHLHFEVYLNGKAVNPLNYL